MSTMDRISPFSLFLASVSHVSLQTWIAYGFAFLFLFLGIGISFALGDWNWFSRSGSLVVIVGLILTSQQIYQHLENLAHHHPSNPWNEESHCSHDWARGSEKRGLYDQRYSNEVVWQKEAHGFYLLIMGTAVWGLGDLVGIYIL